MRHLRIERIKQLSFLFVLFNGVLFYLYLKGDIPFKVLSISDLNPYGGWSAISGLLTDPSYRFRGLSYAVALTVSIVFCALVFGRAFCGIICPVGTLQDFFWRLGRNNGLKKVSFSSNKAFPLELIKYVLLIVFLSLGIMGLGHTLAIASPWLAFLNIASGRWVFSGSVVLILILMVSLVNSRPFCRYLCPLGAIQGLLARYSLIKLIKQSPDAGCNQSLAMCPVDIQLDEGEDISPECIRCTKCVQSENTDSMLGFRFVFFGKILSKSAFIGGFVAVFLLISYALPMVLETEKTSGFMWSLDLQDGHYQGMGIGFNGPIVVEVAIESHKLMGVTVKSHRESSGYYDEVFLMMTKAIIGGQSLDVDNISGATVTSRGYLNAIKSALVQSAERVEAQ